ncbi:MAG: ABC transporter permease [Firmicutes bacterium]|nr:ABC transporter permease [Bacillota bacterium]
MHSVFIVAWSNIKKRKAQSLLVILTMMVSIVLFGTSIGILQNQNDPFEQMFENQKGSQVVLDFDQRHADLNTFVLWWKSQDEIVDVITYPYMMISDSMIHNGSTRSMGSVMLTERVVHDYQTDILTFVQGNDKEYPDEDEIFIPTGYAYNWNIELNDQLEISFNGIPKTFIVAGIVVDPQYSATLTSPSRLWIQDGTLNNYYTDDELNQSLVSIRFHDYSDYEMLMNRYESDFGHPFFGFIYDYHFIAYMYTFVESIIALILLVFSIIILIISIIVIVFTITNGIRSDLKQIGIYKTLGFSKKQTTLVYVFQYVMLLLLALPFGLFISYSLIKVILRQLAYSVGLNAISLDHLFIGLVTSIVMLVLIIMSTILGSRKAVRIKPIETIRYSISDKTNKKTNISLSKLRYMKVSYMIAVKSILSNLKHSIFIFISVVVLAFIFTFSFNIYHSISRMNDNLAMWGFDASEVFITTDSKDDTMDYDTFMDTFKDHSQISAISLHGVMVDASVASQDNISSTTALGFVYGGVWDEIGLTNLSGSNPLHNDEVSISYLTAQKYNKSIGDTIDLYVVGIKKTMKVTGIYQSLNAGGWGFRVKAETVLEIDPNYDLPRYLIKLNDKENVNQFIDEFNASYGQTYTARSVSESGEINIDQIIKMMGLVSITLSLIFGIISIIIVFNFMMIYIYDHKKEFGIYKAIGMDEKTLRDSLRIKITFLSCLGVLVGIPLSIQLTPGLLSLFLTDMGLARFPFEINVMFTIIVFPLSVLIQLISVNLASRKLKSINLRELIVD